MTRRVVVALALILVMTTQGCGKGIKGLSLCESQPDKGGMLCLSASGIPQIIAYKDTGGFKCLNQAGYVGALKQAKVSEDQLIQSLKLKTE